MQAFWYKNAKKNSITRNGNIQLVLYSFIMSTFWLRERKKKFAIIFIPSLAKQTR